MPGEEIFEYESITQPSYYSKQAIAPTGLKAMDQIVATGANTLTLIVNFFQDNEFSNSMYLKREPNNPNWGESDSFPEVVQAILAAKARGLKVVLKPHVESLNRKWRAEFDPEDPKAWFASYKAMMVGYALATQEGGAEMICVGTEMDSMIDPTKSFVDETGATKSYTQAWGEIIDAVRAVYSGKVTYAATYWTVQKVGFWDKVDYIGVDSYIPLTPKHPQDDTSPYNPTVQEMVDAWTKPHFNSWVRDLHGGKSVIDYYRALSEQYGKKVLFAEVGYRSVDGTSSDPGLFGGREEDPPDFQEQVDCYEALFEVMENYGGQWLAGSMMWSYYSFENPMAPIDEGGRDVPWTDYTTQHKPANLTITEHYSSPAHVTGLVWNGTGGADKLDGGYHNDTLNGSGGHDVLWGGAGHDSINGGEGNDLLEGASGNDMIDGGAGQNTAVYSQGITNYAISRSADGGLVVAGPNGTDRLYNIQSLKFGAQVYAAADAVNTSTGPTDPGGKLPLVLWGTKKADVLTGEALGDVIHGLAGKDSLSGLGGGDTLYGGAGNDRLTGGAGQDVFVFNSKLGRTNTANKKTNLDKITDFVVADDTIHLAKSVFKKLPKKGLLAKSAFYKGVAAHDANDRIVYDKKKGALYYDKDGSGDGAAIQFATLSKNPKTISHKDFFVI